MTEEPSDEECQVIAMLTGLKYDPGIRVYGRRVLKKFNDNKLEIEYFDPVTMEVTYIYDGSDPNFVTAMEIIK